MQIIRTLVRVKPHALLFLRKVFGPMRKIVRFFVSTVFVPGYHLFYIAKKHFSRAWRPAKNKFMVFVTNRFAVHITIGVIAVVVIILNIQTNEVRAETFGEKSLLYSIVSDQDNEIIEELALEDFAVEVSSVRYREPTGLSAFSRGVDFISFDDANISIFAGGTLTAPTIAEGAESVAPRTEIETYLVASGDTLSTIASKFGITLNTLLWVNNLSVRSVLKPGSELTILPISGVKHEVASGDTLAKIADKYNAEEEDIIAFNKLASATDIVVGEDLIVPGGEIEAPPPVRRSTPVTSVFSAPSTPPTTSSAPPTTSGSGVMIWPTDLRVITQYFGWNHTGLDIDCKFTNDNYAADDGIVQFTGWKGGYGYAVEINHGNGIVTRYGHHASIYVTAGQQVTKGQAIGRCGTTGRSTGTHLHFEVISGGRFMNPLEYIR